MTGRSNPGTPLIERINRLVVRGASETDCWKWTGTSYQDYCKIQVDGKSLWAHRVSYELFIGPIDPGMYVLHSCDNPSCVNPLHLRQGTQTDNMRDVYARGRQPKTFRNGEQCYQAKLSWVKVEQIRQSQKTVTELAKEYGVSKTTISDVRKGKIWRHKN